MFQACLPNHYKWSFLDYSFRSVYECLGFLLARIHGNKYKVKK